MTSSVIHIFQGWNKIAKGWNKIAEGWNKIAKGWNKIAEGWNKIANGWNKIAKGWNKIAKGWNKIFGMGNWGGGSYDPPRPPPPPGYGPVYVKSIVNVITTRATPCVYILCEICHYIRHLTWIRQSQVFLSLLVLKILVTTGFFSLHDVALSQRYNACFHKACPNPRTFASGD